MQPLAQRNSGRNATKGQPGAEAMSFPLSATPLHLAAMTNHGALAEALLEAEADIGKRTTSVFLWLHATPLDVAERYGRQAVVGVLEARD